MNPRLSLDVRLDGFPRPVGRLDANDDGSIRFVYAPDFLESGRAVSLSLPLKREPFSDALTRAFFDNLLPETDRMQGIIDRHGLDRTDIVDILAHIGGDCPGAISCVPMGDPPINIARRSG